MDYGGSPDNAKFMTLDQINKSNVASLKVAWTYPTQDNVSYVFNPVVVDNVMYVLARNNSLVAIDATTGKEIWIHEALNGIAPRGVNYWESKDRKDRRILFQMNSYLQAIDAQTGKSILTFGSNGVVNLREGLGRNAAEIIQTQSRNPGKIFENLIIMGSAPGEQYISPPGDLRAFDVVTGKLVWTFHTIPRPGEYGYETWPKDAWQYAGAANTWGEITVDPVRGIAYFPTGSPTFDFYGADRHGANLFGNCLIALDARTGKRLWHFQTIHHDLWDWDNVAAPMLTTIRKDGRTIDVVALATKNGFLYVFDRLTGAPIWPIEERPVPPSDIPGEQAWPTQPFPTAPPPFAKQTFTVDDLNPYILTPAQREEWKDRVSKMRGGLQMFTPPAMQETIEMPGAQGGANWGTTASNPTNGTVYVLGINMPSILKMSQEPPRGGGPPAMPTGDVQRGARIYSDRCSSCHGPDREGSGNAPTLIGVGARLAVTPMREIIRGGKDAMPPFDDLNAADLDGVIAFLSSAPAGGSGGRGAGAAPVRITAGPIVAEGGAPAGRTLPKGEALYMVGPPYPQGVAGADLRFYSPYGMNGLIIKPPFATLTAYDLNTGTIKWQVPSGGDDARAVSQGAQNTGFIRARTGIITTSAGLLFQAGGDAKLRAYDVDSGKLLWTGELPAGSTGLSSMYEANGRQYIVVNATSAMSEAVGAPRGAPGYVTFALP
jgi:quinoprotein glucose dehydrogenase